MRYFLFIFLTNAFFAFSQIDLETLKKIANSEIGQKAKGELINKIYSLRSEFDEASFNYAVSLSDNAGLYESEERFKKNKRSILDAFAATQGQQITIESKALSLNSLGEMMYASNKFTSAESSFMEAKKLLEIASDSSDLLYAQIISNISLLYHTTGRYSQAEIYGRKAQIIRKRIAGENSAVYGSSLNNAAVLYKDMGHYNEAEELIIKAANIIGRTLGRESVAYSLSLNNHAMILYATGQAKEAEKLLGEAIEIAGITLKEKSPNFVRLLTNQALMFQDLGKYKEAESVFLKAIKIKERRLSTNHPDYAHLLNNLAALYLLMDKPKEVEKLLIRSSDIYSRKLGEKHPSYASTISNLGNFYRATGEYSKAEHLLVKAEQIRIEVLGDQHPDYISSLENLGLLYWMKGNTAKASIYMRSMANKSLEQINRYFAPLSEAEKARFWNKIRPKFQHFFAFAVSKSIQYPILLTDMYNYQLATKALLLNSTNRIRNQILTGNNKQLKAKYLQWLDKKEELAHAYTLSKAELLEEKIDPNILEKQSNKIEKELSASSGLFAKGYGQKQVTSKHISLALLPNEAAVEIIQLHKFQNTLTDSIVYASLILTKESGTPKLITIKDGNELNKKYFSFYRNSIRLKQKDDLSYAKYWKNIHESLPGIKTVYLSLDGVYNQLNINSILKPDGKYVIEEKEIILVTNTKEILELKKPSASGIKLKTATLIGDPAFGNTGTIAQLPGSQKELSDAKKGLSSKNYKVNYLVKDQATESSIRNLKSAEILHFATHGYFLTEYENSEHEMLFGISTEKAIENPLLRAGLLLANAEKALVGKAEDGILTAYEVTNLQLSNTDLVMLSACETGLGDVKNGEGVYGLQRAFQVAGANTVVMSLWKVDDQATQLLMTSFYKNYLATGNKHKSFRNAQSYLKTKYPEPYYWGAFVMVE